MLSSGKDGSRTNSAYTAGLRLQPCIVSFEPNITLAFMSSPDGRVEVNTVLDVPPMEPSSWTKTPKVVIRQQSREARGTSLVQTARSNGIPSNQAPKNIDNGCVTRHWTMMNSRGEQQRKGSPSFAIKLKQVALAEAYDMAQTLQSLPTRRLKGSVVPLQEVDLMKGSDQLDKAALTTTRR